ncbi:MULTISPECIES: heavy-metal-associated domain-containing protein [unclassified Yoonia]|uniref:heavy-metal-associated domain-containing protein n=1 Tax=unclassified Yoonia TaxID=2629118 RepID=UPI002B00309C|nr:MULTISPECIES: heavy-metal-associated domain-containing protein [unclassified Yoonia]
MQYQIDKMGCGGCARSITNTIQVLDPAADVVIDLPTKRVTVTSKAAQTAIEQALSQAGFPPQRIA